MKKEMLTLGILFVILSVCCQAQNLGDWIVSANAGIEAHDKRGSKQERMLTMPPEKYGTYHAGGLIQRKLVGMKRMGIFGGLGVNYEQATMRRTFNHCYFFDGPCPDILLRQNRYTKISTPTALSFWIRAIENLYLSGVVEANWLIHRRITNSNGGWVSFPYSENTFELDEIQLRLGLNYQIQHFLMGFHVRAFNFQKIDKILFSPSIEETWEWHNPLRFDLTVGYTW